MDNPEIYELKRSLVELLKENGMFDAYKTCVKTMKRDLDMGDMSVDLQCPEHIYCLNRDQLALVASTILAMPLILATGCLVKAHETESKLMEAIRLTKLEKDLQHVDWNKEFFQN